MALGSRMTMRRLGSIQNFNLGGGGGLPLNVTAPAISRCVCPAAPISVLRTPGAMLATGRSPSSDTCVGWIGLAAFDDEVTRPPGSAWSSGEA